MRDWDVWNYEMNFKKYSYISIVVMAMTYCIVFSIMRVLSKLEKDRLFRGTVYSIITSLL